MLRTEQISALTIALKKTRGVSHCGLAIYIKVSEGKKRIMKTQIFHHEKIYSSKYPLKETKNPTTYYNSITNFKLRHKPK
jgi:hypothetical protein